MALDEFMHFFTEEKISTKERNKLDESQFGIPELRKYPLTDEKHVLQAVRFFNKAEEKYKPELARRIVKRAKELNMTWTQWFNHDGCMHKYRKDLSKEDQTFYALHAHENDNAEKKSRHDAQKERDKRYEERRKIEKEWKKKGWKSTVTGGWYKEYAQTLSDTPEAVKCLETLLDANVKYDKATPNTWRLKSPDSVIRNKKGNCHDISYYVYKNLDKFAKKKVGKGILFVMEYKEGSEKGGVTHSVCYEKIKGGVCFIEYSWDSLRGTFPRNNIQEEIDVIKHNWKFSKGFDKLFFAEIKNVDKLHPGMTLDQYVKIATSNKEIISEAFAYDAITGERIDLGPSTMTEEELRSRMVHGNGDDFTSGTSLTRDNEYDEPDDCYCESDGKPWYNDKGLRVPDKCTVCDAPVKIYLRGEPVYLCSNKKCGKYYGTVPCNVNESEGMTETEAFYKAWHSMKSDEELTLTKDIASKIHKKYESDKKEPIGNQNCQLCTWCAEAQFRGIDVLPRPVYSPRDPALEIKGEDIVINPKRISIKSGLDDLLFKITEKSPSRWYCHVKWKDGNGGHEFLLLNIKGKKYPYLMDAQQGIVELLDDHPYFKDTDWSESYICRLDDKEFNKKLFNEYNDPSKVVPWDAKLDIPFMVKEGLLSPEEAEEYFKKYPDEAPQNNGKYLTYEYLNKMFPDGNPIQESHTDLLDETFYRFEYDGEGIYEALRKNMSMNDWKAFKQSKAATWLPVPPNYQPGDQSFFTEKGYNKFMELTYPYMMKYLEKSKIHKFETELNPKYIRYRDEYQVVFNKTKPIQESDEMINIPEGVWMRQATEEDLPNIIQWKMESVSKQIKDDPKVIAYIKKDANKNLKDTKMIMSDDDVIGVLESCWIDNNEWWYIGEIYLIPTYRGKGIAKALLKLDIAGKDKVKLRVAKENTHAIELYKSLGFVISEENDNSYIMIIDKTKPIQEGAWNDIKRGVNPYSKKTWFHVSLSPLHEGKVFKPRVPEYLELTKQGKDDPYYEDMEIPRVCFSPSIEGAIHAITAGFKRIETAGKELYVYIPEKPIDQYKHMTNKEIVDKKLVFDAKYTKECWILEPVKLVLYGTIVIDQVSDHKAKPTANNKGQVSDVSYKWHWQTKPRVIKGMGHEYFYEPDEDKNKSNKKKPIKEEYNMSDFERDPSVFRMFMEADENDSDDKKEDTKESSDNKNDTDEEGDAIVSVSTTEITTTTDEDDDIGTDDGSGEQNQYDPKEVEYLNKLIASEADAISEYFESGKLTRVPVLSKLYTDIGDEERFHLEQLIYAKSYLTGDKYEPKDSKVRREYEELLELGMDEETAMTTAIDKTRLMPEDDITEEEIEEFAILSQMSEMMSFQNEIIMECMDDTSDIRKALSNANTEAFMESVFIMEDVSNLNTKQGQKELGSKNPIRVIIGMFKSIYRIIINLVKKAKLAFQKKRLKNKKKWAWIKKHGIKGLFQSGVSLYFWNDQTNKYEIADALKYLQMVWDTCNLIIKNAGITDIPEEKFSIQKIIQTLGADIKFKPMYVKNLDSAIKDLQGTMLSKSKLIVNDNNQEEIEELFFGYTKSGYETMEREGENSKNINLSKNIYNQMNIVLDAFSKSSAYVGELLNRLEIMEGKSDTIYQKNNKLYNKCVQTAGELTKALNKFNAAVSHDISTVTKIDNGLMEAVNKADEGDKTDLNKLNDDRAKAKAEAQQNAANEKNEENKNVSRFDISNSQKK